MIWKPRVIPFFVSTLYAVNSCFTAIASRTQDSADFENIFTIPLSTDVQEYQNDYPGTRTFAIGAQCRFWNCSATREIALFFNKISNHIMQLNKGYKNRISGN